MDWKEKIHIGMEMIMEGCSENYLWINCHECPFDTLCRSIYKDRKKHHFSIPESWKEEEIFNKV